MLSDRSARRATFLRVTENFLWSAREICWPFWTSALMGQCWDRTTTRVAARRKCWWMVRRRELSGDERACWIRSGWRSFSGEPGVPARLDGRGARPHTRKLSARSAAVVSQLAADPGLEHLDFANLHGIDAEHVVTKQHHVGQFPGSNRTFFFLLKFGIGRTHGVGLNRFFNSQLLLGKPSIRILAIERRARCGRIQREHGVERRDIPIRAQSEADAVVEECAESISATGAVVPDAALSPAAVVDGVIGLHGRDYVQLSEAVEVFGGHMLRVLDAPATITAAMRFFDLVVNVED